jgi:hypothetical protein
MRKDIAVVIKKLATGRTNPQTARLVQSHKQFDAAIKTFVREEMP